MAEMSIIESLFFGAVEQKSAEKRVAYLDEHCPDPGTRDEVERLLAAHPDAGSFLQYPALSAEATVDSAIPCEGIGTEVGPYKLLQLIGEGGFGLVYMAEQKAPIRRKVALKIIKPGMDTKEVIGRFEAERQALALMDHPNVAKVLDAGTTQSGHPYFVMELVRGTSITEFCDDNNLDTRERLELFIPVCRAIQHAHQKAIIHRDIKPSNVLVTMHDDKAVPKVIDFGIAKALHTELTARTVFTQFQQMIGTPAYMSPEQAQMSGLDVDTRCDVYALGVLLYELLTGTTPFDPEELLRGGYDEICKRIREQEPPRPSNRVSTMDDASRTAVAKSRKTDPEKLGWFIRGDLDWIVMKAMEKDRTRRYETANGLAQDVKCFLASEPVSAVAPSNLYRLRKFVRRNKAAVFTIAAFTTLLGIGIVVSSLLAIAAVRNLVEAEDNLVRATTAEQTAKVKEAEATRERDRALRLAYNGRVTVMLPDWNRGNFERVRLNLEATASWPERGFEWYYWQRQTHREVRTLRRGDEHRALAITRDGSRVITGVNDGKMCAAVFWDASTGKFVKELSLGRGVVHAIDLTPDGSKLLTVTTDGSLLWELVDGTSRAVSVEAVNLVSGVFSPDGKHILVGCDDGTARLLDSETLTEIQMLEANHVISKTHEGVAGVAFSPDGQLMATSAWHDVKVCLFKRDEVKPFLEILLDVPRGASLMQALCFSPDGTSIAFGSPSDPLVRVWDADAKQEQFTLQGHDRGIFCLDWVGDHIFTGGTDGTARVWDVESREEVAIFKGHAGPLWDIKATPSHPGRFVTGSARDTAARIWSVRRTQKPLIIPMEAASLAYVPGSHHLAVGCGDGSVKIVDSSTGRTLRELRPHATAVRRLAVFPDGEHIVTTGEDSIVRISRLGTEKIVQEFTDHASVIWNIDLSCDGRWLVVGEGNQTVRVRDLHNNGQVVFKTTVHSKGVEEKDLSTQGVAISPSGEQLVTAGEDRKLRVWDRQNQQQPRANSLAVARGGVIGHIEYSTDGSRFVTGGFQPRLIVWDASTGQPISECIGHTQWINDVTFSHDGTRVASACHDGTARLWDASTGDELLTLEHASSVGNVAISPDGRQIATRADGKVFVWDAASDDEVATWQQRPVVSRDAKSTP